MILKSNFNKEAKLCSPDIILNGRVFDEKWGDAHLKINNSTNNPYANLNWEGTQLTSPVMRDCFTNSKIETFTSPLETFLMNAVFGFEESESKKN